MTKWRDISTAPKDGTRILVVKEGEGDIEITEWYETEYVHYEPVRNNLYRKIVEKGYSGWNGNGHRATHWMPLPEPPEREGEG